MAVITISKEYASESEVFARRLSLRMGYEIFDKQFLQHISRMAEGYDGDVYLIQKSQTSRILEMVDKAVISALKETLGRNYGRVDDSYYFRIVKDLIEKIAEQDNVIIVGWGGQCILANNPKTIHVRIVKNVEERMAILKQKFGLDDRGARDLIKREEEDSSRYISHYFNRLWDDPHLYHIVLNLSKIGFEDAVDIVENLARSVG